MHWFTIVKLIFMAWHHIFMTTLLQIKTHTFAIPIFSHECALYIAQIMTKYHHAEWHLGMAALLNSKSWKLMLENIYDADIIIIRDYHLRAKWCRIMDWVRNYRCMYQTANNCVYFHGNEIHKTLYHLVVKLINSDLTNQNFLRADLNFVRKTVNSDKSIDTSRCERAEISNRLIFVHTELNWCLTRAQKCLNH